MAPNDGFDPSAPYQPAQTSPAAASSAVSGFDPSAPYQPTQTPEEKVITSGPAPGPRSGVLGTAEDVAPGFAKGAGDTVSGISHLLNKIPVVGETLAPSTGVSALDKMDVADGTAEMAGKGIENIAEFAAGDEALEGLSKATKLVALAKKYPQIAEVLNMAKDHPILAKMISSGGKAAAVGAAQGAVKGAQKDNAVAGAEAGAAGGAVGGPLGEALAGTPEYLLRKFGLGGLTSAEAIIKAGRPNVKEALGGRFADAWVNAKPILQDIPNKTIKTAGDFEDALHEKANDLWTNTIQPVIDKHKNEAIDGNAIATAIRKGVDQNVGMRDLFPEQVAPIESMAKHFADTGALSLDKANGYLKTLNAQLKDYYRMSPEARNAAGVTSGRLSSMEDAADAIREQLYNKVDTLEGQATGTARAQRVQYGALKDLERVFGKRAVVADRQAPLNLQQILGMSEAATAMLAGHPLTAAAGAVPFITKARSTPESLIRQGLSAARREAAGPGAVSTAANAVVTGATPNVASQAAQAVVPQGETPPNPNSGATATSAPAVKGLVQQGNIDVNHRPVIWNDDGTPSTIFSATVPTGDGKFALVPTIVNGRFLTSDGKIPKETDKKAMQVLEDRAAEQYRKTGEHLGIFDSEEAADDYADKTHAWMPNGGPEKVYTASYRGESNMPLTRKEYEAELARRKK